jgi:hypothetical protein
MRSIVMVIGLMALGIALVIWLCILRVAGIKEL